MTAQRKRYRIETHPAYAYRSALDEAEALTDPAEGGEGPVARHRELMEAIASLEAKLLRGVLEAPAEGNEGPSPAEDGPARHVSENLPCMSEVRQLKAELDCMQAAIVRTTKEIAALHTKGPQNAHVTSATDQLDAVVEGTEKATTAILGASEEIDQMAAMLHHSLKDSQDKAMAEDIQHQVVRIFEACNFQDLAGQRISKVVSTLHFIEERVMRMIELWGGIDAFHDIEPEEMPKPTGDDALLNGPALEHEEDQASQDDRRPVQLTDRVCGCRQPLATCVRPARPR